MPNALQQLQDMEDGAGSIASPLATASEQACLNCGAIRVGPYCHVCGQHAHESHRSIKRMLAEGLRAATESDGPFLRTLRRLAFDPGRLTLDYLAGKRAAQVSPVRLFLFSLALFLIIADHEVIVQFANATPAQLAALPPWLVSFSNFIHAHGVSFLSAMHGSAELFAVLTVPIAALLLKLIYLNRRALTLYDHAVVAGYSLAFQMVMLAIILALPDSVSAFGWLPFAAMCAHLFVHLRGVYGGRVSIVLLRMAMLATLSVVAYAILSFCWMAAAALTVAA
jgi:hypothetical protein